MDTLKSTETPEHELIQMMNWFENSIKPCLVVETLQIASKVMSDEKHRQKMKLIHETNVQFASCYMNYMYEKISDAISKLQTTMRKSIVLNCVPTHSFGVVTENGPRYHPFHRIHYGPILNHNWRLRKYVPEFHFLFRKLQQIMFSKGYWLLDLSDPSKSHQLRIVLFVEKPPNYSTIPELWHGYQCLNENDTHTDEMFHKMLA